MESLKDQGNEIFLQVPTFWISFLYFAAGILMQMQLNGPIENGMIMMKYALNHYWKFKYVTLAFTAGFLQVTSCLFIAFINYAVILQSNSIQDLAKDFVALMIIAQFDDMFANYSMEQIVKEILLENKQDYEDIFTIETTSSAESEGPTNIPMPRDKIFDKVKENMVN
jgi:hypothetical protein